MIFFSSWLDCDSDCYHYIDIMIFIILLLLLISSLFGIKPSLAMVDLPECPYRLSNLWSWLSKTVTHLQFVYLPFQFTMFQLHDFYFSYWFYWSPVILLLFLIILILLVIILNWSRLIFILPDDFIGHDTLLRVCVRFRCPKFHGWSTTVERLIFLIKSASSLWGILRFQTHPGALFRGYIPKISW